MFVQEVRDVSMKSYKAAQAKDQEKMIDLSEALSWSCAGCHRKWRDRRTPDNRCKWGIPRSDVSRAHAMVGCRLPNPVACSNA